MKLTRSEEVAILVAAELASQDGRWKSLKDIGNTHGISFAFLKKVTRFLKQAGLVISKEGIGGGYTLAKPADQISIFSLLQALESQKMIINVQLHKSRTCPIHPNCLPNRIRGQIETTFLNYCNNVTLDQLIKEYKI